MKFAQPLESFPESPKVLEPMPMGNRLSKKFFQSESTMVAPKLIGKTLAMQQPDGSTLRLMIVETEAYLQSDPASHAFRGPSARNGAMFGPAGVSYVYFIYGMYHCLNVVTGKVGDGQAVLIRALAPLDFHCRPKPELRQYSGPGKLCRELKIDRTYNGINMVEGHPPIWLETGILPTAKNLVCTTRIGITKGAEQPWRWYWREHPSVSKF